MARAQGYITDCWALKSSSIDWLIFIEHKTNVYALVTIEINFKIYVVHEKNTKKRKKY